MYGIASSGLHWAFIKLIGFFFAKPFRLRSQVALAMWRK
jgi:hypothetical protein